MKTINFFMIAYFVFFTGKLTAQTEIPEDFTPLFNGKDFTGWNIEPDLGAWYIEDEKIICKGDPAKPYLILTKKEYENFELYVDFKMSENCNSGIFMHQIKMTEEGWARGSYVGMEIQILDDAGKGSLPASTTGSVYNALPALSNAVKPAGLWNRYYIIMNWPVLQIWLNGQLVQNANLEDHEATRYKMRRGFIGLQNHNFYIEFKNIYIKELPPKENITDLFNGINLNGWKAEGDAQWKVENGEIKATGGDGWLVSEEEFENYELRIFAGKYENGGTSGIYYNWNGVKDPGFKAEFRDWGPQNNMGAYKYQLTQIINYGDESYVRNNGELIQSNQFHNTLKKGKVAVYHSAVDGLIKIPKISIKQLNKSDSAEEL